VLVLAAVFHPCAARAQQPQSDPALDHIVRKMANYVAAYGARTSVIVAVEKYTQQVEIEGRRVRPRNLVAEFAIVKVAGQVGWTGFRDVVQVDGKSVADRQDRLLSLLTGQAGGEGELRRMADESARYNVGAVARNFNVPTTALFFFHPEHVGRFSFRRTGTKTIDGVMTWVLDFKETRRPTLVMKRNGTDVPCEGTVWVVPDDGTVVRTRLRLRNFANLMTMTGVDDSPADRVRWQEYVIPTPPPQTPAPQTPPPQTSSPQTPPPTSPGQPSTGTGTTNTQPQQVTQPSPADRRMPEMPDVFPDIHELESLADIDVTYRREAVSGMWLPAKMTEVYEGPIPRGTGAPVTGRTVGLARYSDFRRFETSVRIVVPR
jgi:hypothetical protein